MEPTATIDITQSNTTSTTPVVPSIVPDTTLVQTPPANLIDKVAQFKKTQVKTVSAPAETYKDFDDIKDPIAKEVAINRDKQRQADYTRKTQDLAQQRKDYEQKLVEMQNWSPDRIQKELLNNPQFLQAAQQIQANQNPVNSGLTDQQFSALTPEEQATIGALKNEVNTLKQVNYQAIVAQRDSQLQTKYPDYNSTQIDTVIRDLAQMNPLDIREHVYKSIKHDEDVAAAYESGRQETRELTQNKIQGITQNGTSIATSDGLPLREKGDTDQTYFMKMATFRLAQFKNRK